MAQENDVVLIHLEEQPMTFARIESIAPDAKPEWFQVKLLMLQVPLQVTTWILRPAYIDGAPFTMGGKQVRIEKVVCPEEDGSGQEAPSPGTHPPQQTDGEKTAEGEPANDGKVISLADLKKKT